MSEMKQLTVQERLNGLISAIEKGEYQNTLISDGLGLFKDCRTEFRKNIDELNKRGIPHNYNK